MLAYTFLCLFCFKFHSTDEDVIDEVVSIFKAVFLNSKFSSGGNITDTWKLDVVMPLLLNLLDERDVTTRAVIILIAESCLMYGSVSVPLYMVKEFMVFLWFHFDLLGFIRSRDNQFLLEVFKRFDSDSIMQRRNAIDVISEIVQMSSNTRNLLTQSAWYICTLSSFFIFPRLDIFSTSAPFSDIIYCRQDTANQLIKCLEDEEILIRKQAADLLPCVG